jgi:hypothetical protein
MKSYLLALLPLLSLQAAVVPRVAFEQLVTDSTRIVHGRVLSSQVASSGQFLWTHYRVQVFDSIKGAPPTEVTVSEPGGTLNGIQMDISGAVEFRPGEEVVLFLYQTPIGYWRIRGAWQGKFDVTGSTSGKHVRATLINQDTAANARAAAGRPLDSLNGMPLADFVAAIRRQVAK